VRSTLSIHGCSKAIRHSWNVVGCGDNSPQDEDTLSANNGDPNDHNIIHEAERVISWFGTVYGFYMAFYGAFAIAGFFDKLRDRRQGPWSALRWGKGHKEIILGLSWAIFTFGFVVAIALVSIPHPCYTGNNAEESYVRRWARDFGSFHTST
jgi:hypothetical protein